MPKLFDLVKVNIATTGTGTITFGSVFSPEFFTPAEAGAVDGDAVRYVLIDGTDVELGIGVIGGTVTTMTRTASLSRISGVAGTSKINLSGTAYLAFTATSREIVVGPSSVVPGRIASFYDTTGKMLQDSGVNVSLGSADSSFSAHKNGTDQTGITGDNSTYTQVTFGTEVWDTGSNFASSTWTPPAGKALINVQLYISGTFAAGNVFTGAIYKNGSLLKEGFVYAARANNTIVTVNVIVDCNGTDAFTVRVKGQADSGTLTVNGQSKWSFFTGSMI